MPPSPSPSPPAPTPEPPIDIAVLPPAQTPVPNENHTTVGVTIPQEIWKKISSDMIGVTRCKPQGGVSGFLCENSDTYSQLADAVSSVVTVLAIIVGAMWAYRKFVQGRTFQPRTSVEVSAQWHVLANVGHVLQVRTRVTNIGGAKLNLYKPETGMKVLLPAHNQTHSAHRRSVDEYWPDVRWEYVPLLGEQGVPMAPDAQGTRTFAIFQSHDFIEPGENVFSDTLLNLGREPTIIQVQAKVCWVVPHWYQPDWLRRRYWPENWWPTQFWPTAWWPRSWWRQQDVVGDLVDQIIPPGTAIYNNDRGHGQRAVPEEV